MIEDTRDMGHHGFKPKRHRRRMDRNEGRDRDDDFARAPFPRIPRVAVLGGIALWTLLALGLWALIDPLLAWGAGMAGPGADLAVGVARWFGLGGEAAALRDATDVNGLVGWAAGAIHVLAKSGLVLVWLAGLVALVVVPALLRRRARW